MKTISSYVLAGLALLLLSGFCWKASQLDRDLTKAAQNVATLNYDGVEETYDRAARYFEIGSRLPGIGTHALNDIRARKAELYYWQRRYDTIVPQAEDPVATLPADNVELQFVIANAVYRNAQAHAKDRQSVLQALDAGIKAYLVVLKNSTRHDGAAYNYEYLIEQRGALLAGSGKPKGGDGGEESNPHGQAGGAPQQTQMNDFKIQIPLEPKEFEDQKNGQEAGKNVARERRG